MDNNKGQESKHWHFPEYNTKEKTSRPFGHTVIFGYISWPKNKTIYIHIYICIYIYWLPNIPVNLLRPDEASEAASDNCTRQKSAYFHFKAEINTVEAKWFDASSLAFGFCHCPTEQPAFIHAFLSPGAEDLFSNEAQRNFKIGLTSPLNDQRAAQRRGVRYFLFPC